MRFYDFEFLIEKEPEDEGYFAYNPTLADVSAMETGSTSVALSI